MLQAAPSTLFPTSYAEARAAWLDEVQRVGGRVQSLQHPLTGPDGGSLWMDAAWFGDAAARRVMVVACATHGIEGHAGSAAQTAWLATDGPGEVPADTAVLLIRTTSTSTAISGTTSSPHPPTRATTNSTPI
jgi:hypothetical protein